MNVSVEYFRNDHLALAGVGDQRAWQGERSEQVTKVKLSTANPREWGEMQNEQDCSCTDSRHPLG